MCMGCLSLLCGVNEVIYFCRAFFFCAHLRYGALICSRKCHLRLRGPKTCKRYIFLDVVDCPFRKTEPDILGFFLKLCTSPPPKLTAWFTMREHRHSIDSQPFSWKVLNNNYLLLHIPPSQPLRTMHSDRKVPYKPPIHARIKKCTQFQISCVLLLIFSMGWVYD